MGFLRDPIWQFVSVIIAVIALLLPFLLSLLGRKKKEVKYEIISTSLLSIKEDVRGAIQVLFNGNQVDDVQLAIIRIWNTGNVPILPNDFVEPIKIQFGQKSRILDTEVLERIPSNINVSLQRNFQAIVIEPLLLNAQDSIKLKVLVANPEVVINADARIVGVKQLIKYEPSKGDAQLAYRALLSYLLGTVLFVVTGIFLPQHDHNHTSQYMISYMFCVALASYTWKYIPIKISRTWAFHISFYVTVWIVATFVYVLVLSNF